MQAKVHEITFTDEDIVNYDAWIPEGEYNPYNVVPWLIAEHGFVVCIVFASNVQDALDEACDAGKLDAYMVRHTDDNDDAVTFLGNAGEAFDLESIEILQLPNPGRSFVAQFNAMKESEAHGTR